MAEAAVRTHVILPKKLVDKIDREFGPRRRSEFLTKAAIREFERRERSKALEEFAGSLADVDIPGWETSESAAEWVREQRRNWRDPWAEARDEATP